MANLAKMRQRFSENSNHMFKEATRKKAIFFRIAAIERALFNISLEVSPHLWRIFAKFVIFRHIRRSRQHRHILRGSFAILFYRQLRL